MLLSLILHVDPLQMSFQNGEDLIWSEIWPDPIPSTFGMCDVTTLKGLYRMIGQAH